MRLLPVFFLFIGLLAGCSGGDDNGSDNTKKPPPPPEPRSLACEDNADFFQNRIWQDILKPSCLSCHEQNPPEKFPLVDETAPDSITENMASFTQTAKKQTEQGVSYMVAKPQQLPGAFHPQKVFTAEANGAELADLQSMADSLIACEPEPEPRLVFNSGRQQLRKLTLNLAGRLPAAEEIAAVDAAGDDLTAQQQVFDRLLDDLLSEAGFAQRLREIYNDLLLTDRYLDIGIPGLNQIYRDAVFSVDALMQAGYKTVNSQGREVLSADGGRIRRFLRHGIARAPLELIIYVIQNDRPFSEILTADYVFVSPFTATLYNLVPADEPDFAFDYRDGTGYKNPLPDPMAYDRFAYRRMQVSYADDAEKLANPLGPQAGLLTDFAFLNRYPSTRTNRNRHRANITMRYFLDTDAEGLASRESLQLDAIQGDFPPFEDPQCRQCHDVVDPIAGMFKNRHFNGGYPGIFVPTCTAFVRGSADCGQNFRIWYSDRLVAEMHKPGFTMETADRLAVNEYADALPRLARWIVADQRFVQSSIKWVFKTLTGQSLDNHPVFEQALQRVFMDSQMNMKAVIKAIVQSDIYRAVATDIADSGGDFEDSGSVRLLTPERLHAKLQAVFGYEFQSLRSRQTLMDRKAYTLFYGGIDSHTVTERQSEPTAIMAAIQDRIAMQTGCETVPQDFILPAGERRLFPYVAITDVPDDAAMTAKIKQNIQYLHRRVLGESLEPDDPEITHTYDLFVQARQQIPLDDAIHFRCRRGIDANDPVRLDNQGTVRAWMAVIAYMIMDYKFLYE